MSPPPLPRHTPWRSWQLWLSRNSSITFSEFTADAMNLARAFNPRTRMNENSDRASRKPFRRHNTTSLYNLWSVSALTSSNTPSDWGFLASAGPASGASVVNRSSAQFGCLRIIVPPLATVQPTSILSQTSATEDTPTEPHLVTPLCVRLYLPCVLTSRNLFPT